MPLESTAGMRRARSPSKNERCRLWSRWTPSELLGGHRKQHTCPASHLRRHTRVWATCESKRNHTARMHTHDAPLTTPKEWNSEKKILRCMQPLPLQLFFLRDKRERVSECRPPQNTCASKRCLMVFEIPQEGYLRRGSNTSKHRLEEDIEVCWPSSEFLF
jgi:hypothetical protein